MTNLEQRRTKRP